MDISTVYNLLKAQGLKPGKPTVSENSGEAVIAEAVAQFTEAASVMIGGETVVLTAGERSALAEALQMLGFAATEENIALVKTLVQSGFPVNKENINLLNQAQKLTNFTPEKAVFFLQNEIKPSPANAEIIKSFASNELRLVNQFAKLSELVGKLPDKTFASKLNDLLFYGGEEDTDSTAILPDNTEALPAGSISTSDTLEIKAKTPVIPDSKPDSTALASESASKSPNPVTTDEAAQTSDNPQTTLKSNGISLAEENIFIDDSAQNYVVSTEEADLLLLEKSRSALSLAAASNEADEQNLPAKTMKLSDNGTVPQDSRLTDEAAETGFRQLSFSQTDDEEYKKLENIRLQKYNRVLEAEGKTPEKSVRAALDKKYSVNIDKPDVRDIDRLLNNAKEGASAVKHELANNGLVDNQIYKTADDLIKNLDFLNHMKTGIYVQLPVLINGDRTDCDIFVFSDKRKRSEKGGTKSALVALETVNMGRVETYVVKNDSRVKCQFRISDDKTENVFRTNVSKLHDILRNKGLLLENSSFFRLEQPFNLTDAEPKQEVINIYDGHGIDIST